MPTPAPDRSPAFEYECVGLGAPAGHVAGQTRRKQRISVHGLLVPWDQRRPCQVQELTLTAVSLSDAIGGGLLEEGLHGQVDGVTFSMYLDEDRVARGLPTNERAAALSARIGQVDGWWLTEMRGDALFLGCDEQFADTDVPEVVIEAARRGGLLPGGEVGR
jgi:hypothetical protein